MERGEAFLESGRRREALLEFQSALALRPDDAALYERIGQVLVTRGQLDEAVRYFRQAREIDPSRLEAAMNEAWLIASSDTELARQLVDDGLRRAPEMALVQRAQAHVTTVEGDLDAALDAAERAVALDAETVANWAELGAVHEARIRERSRRGLPPDETLFRAALETYDRLDRTQGGYPRAHIAKARIYAAWPGHDEEAVRSLDAALDLARQKGFREDTAAAARALADFADRRRNWRLKRRALTELVAVDDDDYEAWDTLGQLAETRRGTSGEQVYLDLLERRPDDPRAHLLYARHLARAGSDAEAEAHVVATIEAGVEDPVLFAYLVGTRLQAGRVAEARVLYERMSRSFPDAPATRVSHARVLLAEGRADEAAEDLHLQLQGEEGHELQRLLALAELQRGNLDAARRAISRAVELAPPNDFAVLRLKARIHFEDHSWAEMLEAYRLLLARKQELSVEERLQLATGLARTGQHGACMLEFRDLLAANPPLLEVVVAYADLQGSRDPWRARKLLEEAHRRAPANDEVLRALTRLELLQGRRGDARARLDRVVAERLASPEILLLRAQLAAESRDWETAEADVLRAFEADPELPGAIDLLLSVYRAQDRLEEARRSFEQADEAGILHSGARLLLARLYLAEGDAARAWAMLERLLDQEPGLWQAQRELAVLMADQGEEMAAALRLAREADSASGRLPVTADALGYVYLRAERPEAALREFRRAIRRAARRGDQDDASFRYHEGLALQRLGRHEQAARAFRAALTRGDFPGAADARRQLEAAQHPEAEPGSSS
jgi:tetratricopeptide (TPR) repeat protein